MRRERERNGRRGLIGKLIAAKSLGSATTHILMLNHQCPRLRCRTREPAANLLSICLLGCSSRDLQSCGCFSCLYVFGCKITKNPAYSDTFCKSSYGLIAFSLFKGFDILFFYLLKSFLFQIMCYPHCPFVNNIC